VRKHVTDIFDMVDSDTNELIDWDEMKQNYKYFVDTNFIRAGEMVHDDL